MIYSCTHAINFFKLGGILQQCTSTYIYRSSLMKRLKSTNSRLSYFHKIGPDPLRQITIGQMLDVAAEKWPERLAVYSVLENKKLTFRDVNVEVNRVAAGFKKLGLKKGDRLAILGPNSLNWYITLFAAAKAGLVLVNVNPAFQKDELEYCLKKVGVKAVVSDETFKTQNYYKMINDISPEISKIAHGTEINSDNLPEFKHLIMFTDKRLPGISRFEDIKNDDVGEIIELTNIIQPDDPFNIQFTSGTTGYPKAAVLTHFMVFNNSFFFGKRYGYHKKHHSICLQVPLFHTFGTSLGILSALSHGATLVMPGKSFKPNETIEALKKVRCTIIYGTPTMYIDLCDLINKELSNNDDNLKEALNYFEIIVSGGAVCTPYLFRLMSDVLKCTNVNSAYGMTETSPIMMLNTDKDTYEQKVTTVGCVAEHAEIKVVDSEGKMVPFGTPGEVWFRSYATMLGYWGDDKLTNESITPCKWMKSGDLFILTEDGYGRVVGRIKDMIIRGGENIYPVEIEQFLEKHPDILEAQIAHFKIPKYIRFVEDFPKTASGKVKKFELRELAEKEFGVNKKIK